ncbi:MAG TPA: diadenylate cyclase [Planctomycetota bacterium]|nr:diadenylate cyclase [Planctomycetota bacterium]
MFDWPGWMDWRELSFYTRSGIEIAILYLLLYWLLVGLERISAGGKLKGLSLAVAGLVCAAMVARVAQLHAISWLLQASIGFSAIIMGVVFQPELRRLFTRMGGLFPNQDLSANASIIQQMIDAITSMADRRIGALIVVERSDRLDDYINTSPLDCEVTAKSVMSLFWKDTPLHDGAMIIRDGRIAAAGVILPLTENIEYKHLPGTRHRAGIGISEDTDALALLVSEETGSISVADRGKLNRGLTRQDLEILLGRTFAGHVRRSSGL